MYIEFGMSQSKLHCTKVGDEPGLVDCHDFTTIQLDLIKIDDYIAGSCAINPMAFLFAYIFVTVVQLIFQKLDHNKGY